MHLPTTTALFFTLAATATLVSTAPTASPNVLEMQRAFATSAQCKLPTPQPSCSGAERSDIIVTYNSSNSNAVNTASSKSLLLDAAKAAGGDVVFEWEGFGFAGFVPKGVVALLREFSEDVGVRIWDNACLQVPSCGEEPC